MAKKVKNMALSHILEAIGKNALKVPQALFSGGISADAPFLPEDILVWKSSSEQTVTDVSIHQRMILKIILSGDVITSVDGLRIPMKPGDMILFFPFQFHSTRLLCAPSEYSFLAITFTEKTRNYSSLLPLKNHLLSPDKSDARRIETIIRTWLRRDRPAPEKAVLALMDLLWSQRRRVLRSEMEQPLSSALPRETADRISDYFRNHFTSPISLKTVATEFGISEETIRRIFHKSYGGITPGKLIRRLRMQFALEMLEHTGEPIARIAEQCGYSDTFVFSKAFKRLTGLSPQQHRKNYLEGISGRKPEERKSVPPGNGNSPAAGKAQDSGEKNDK